MRESTTMRLTLALRVVDRFRVVGGGPLRGEIEVVGAKNSALKLMAAALLAPGATTLTNVPDIVDVAIMAELLRRLGCAVTHDVAAGRVEIDVPERPGHRADYERVRAMRASISVLGPLTARCGIADVAVPGGDAIGSRGLDLHASGLTRLGATVHVDHGYLVAEAPDGLVGAPVALDFPSVGATENVLMAAVLARGTTIVVNGVPELHPVEHRVVPDRIATGTWAFAAAMTRGDVTIHGADARHLTFVLDKLTDAGVVVEAGQDSLRVICPRRPRAFDVMTLPYPGFPTDLQPFALVYDA